MPHGNKHVDRVNHLLQHAPLPRETVAAISACSKQFSSENRRINKELCAILGDRAEQQRIFDTILERHWNIVGGWLVKHQPPWAEFTVNPAHPPRVPFSLIAHNHDADARSARIAIRRMSNPPAVLQDGLNVVLYQSATMNAVAIDWTKGSAATIWAMQTDNDGLAVHVASSPDNVNLELPLNLDKVYATLACLKHFGDIAVVVGEGFKPPTAPMPSLNKLQNDNFFAEDLEDIAYAKFLFNGAMLYERIMKDIQSELIEEYKTRKYGGGGGEASEEALSRALQVIQLHMTNRDYMHLLQALTRKEPDMAVAAAVQDFYEEKRAYFDSPSAYAQLYASILEKQFEEILHGIRTALRTPASLKRGLVVTPTGWQLTLDLPYNVTKIDVDMIKKSATIHFGEDTAISIDSSTHPAFDRDATVAVAIYNGVPEITGYLSRSIAVKRPRSFRTGEALLAAPTTPLKQMGVDDATAERLQKAVADWRPIRWEDNAPSGDARNELRPRLLGQFMESQRGLKRPT